MGQSQDQNGTERKKKSHGFFGFIGKLFTFVLILFILANIAVVSYAAIQKKDIWLTVKQAYGYVYCLAKGHDYAEETVEATCETEGYTHTVCKRCGKEEQYAKTEEPLGHTYELTETVAVTCTTEGYTLHTCTRCNGTEKRDVVQPLGHDWAKESTVPATCTEQGYDTYQCNHCGETEKRNFTEVLPHAYREEYFAPRCEADGYKLFTCADCGASYQEVEEGSALEHDMQYSSEKAPTCTEEGWTLYLCAREGCNESRVEKIAKINHQTAQVEKRESTCEEDGYILYECAMCHGTNRQVLKATGHSLVSASSPATCTEGACEWEYCTRSGCDYKEILSEGSPLGHIFVKGVCVRYGCGAEEVSTADMQFACANGTATLTRYNGSAASVQIPAYYNQLPVRSVSDYAFQNCANLAEVTIPREITEISAMAFTNCSVLSKVSFNGSEVAWRYLVENNTVLKSIANVSFGVGNYGYTTLAQNEKNTYYAIYSMFEDFRLKKTEVQTFTFDGQLYYQAGSFHCDTYSVSPATAASVLQLVRYDCPTFWWIKNSFMILDAGQPTAEVKLLVDADWTSAAIRDGYEQRIEETVVLCRNKLTSAMTETEKANVLFGYVSKAVSYAYDENGNAESANWAHSIVGFLDGEGVVCEGYAKTYQLLCDRLGIRCMTLIGTAFSQGYYVPHAWNAVCTDGNWRYVDVTWKEFGTARTTFEQNHRKYSEENGGLYWWFALPENFV